MLRVFIGYDHRQPISYHVLCHSIIKHTTKPVSITPLILNTLPLKRQGLTPFTYSRFLVPYLCDYKGIGLFLDADMLLMDDISKLFHHADGKHSIYVAKNVEKFEWASVMLFDCEKCKILTPEYIEKAEKLHHVAFVPEAEIGTLPAKWNHLVGYDDAKPTPSLVHYTQGVPCFPETQHCEHAEAWCVIHKEMNSAKEWKVLMGNSVHAIHLTNYENRPIPRYMFDLDKRAPKPEYIEIVKALLSRPVDSK